MRFRKQPFLHRIIREPFRISKRRKSIQRLVVLFVYATEAIHSIMNIIIVNYKVRHLFSIFLLFFSLLFIFRYTAKLGTCNYWSITVAALTTSFLHLSLHKVIPTRIEIKLKLCVKGMLCVHEICIRNALLVCLRLKLDEKTLGLDV